MQGRDPVEAARAVESENRFGSAGGGWEGSVLSSCGLARLFSVKGDCT